MIALNLVHEPLVQNSQAPKAMLGGWVSSLPTVDPCVVVAPTSNFQPQGWCGKTPLPWDSELSPEAITCFPWFITKRQFCLDVADCLQWHPGCDASSWAGISTT